VFRARQLILRYSAGFLYLEFLIQIAIWPFTDVPPRLISPFLAASLKLFQITALMDARKCLSLPKYLAPCVTQSL
jgi:hypothetical protein